jgi:hypothetical protein
MYFIILRMRVEWRQAEIRAQFNSIDFYLFYFILTFLRRSVEWKAVECIWGEIKTQFT